MNHGQVVYCIDTSAVIDLFKFFPSDVFVTMHERLADLLDQRRLLLHRLVKAEIARRGPDGSSLWSQSVPAQNMIEIDNEQGRFISRLETELPAYAAQFTYPEYQQSADPFLVACGSIYGYTIVTQEANRAAKIPYLCDHFNIHSLSLLDMFRDAGWQF